MSYMVELTLKTCSNKPLSYCPLTWLFICLTFRSISCPFQSFYVSFDVMFIVSLRQLLATKLGVISTQITKADKAEHIKRKRHTAAQTAHSSKNGFNGEKWNYDVCIHHNKLQVRSLNQHSRCILSSSVTWNCFFFFFCQIWVPDLAQWHRVSWAQVQGPKTHE